MFGSPPTIARRFPGLAQHWWEEGLPRVVLHCDPPMENLRLGRESTGGACRSSPVTALTGSVRVCVCAYVSSVVFLSCFFFNLFEVFGTMRTTSCPISGFSVTLQEACELFCLRAFCQCFLLLSCVHSLVAFMAFLLHDQHVRLLLFARSSFHPGAAQPFGCTQIAARWHGGQRLWGSVSATSQKRHLRGFSFLILPARSVVSIPTPWLPFYSRARDSVSPRDAPPTPRLSLLSHPTHQIRVQQTQPGP